MTLECSGPERFPLSICISFYYNFSEHFAIDDTRQDKDGMGPWMEETWRRACDTIWRNTILPKLENEDLAREIGPSGGSVGHLFFRLRQKATYDAIRNMQSEMVTAFSQCQNHRIDSVLVPRAKAMKRVRESDMPPRNKTVVHISSIAPNEDV
jgi:hypothetical protein